MTNYQNWIKSTWQRAPMHIMDYVKLHWIWLASFNYMCVEFREYSSIYIIQKHSKHRQKHEQAGIDSSSTYTACPLSKESTCEWDVARTKNFKDTMDQQSYGQVGLPFLRRIECLKKHPSVKMCAPFGICPSASIRTASCACVSYSCRSWMMIGFTSACLGWCMIRT